MPDSENQDRYIKPPVKMLTRDLTEKYVKEIVKEAARKVLKDREDTEKMEQAWNCASKQDQDKYLHELEKKLTEKIQNISTNEQDLLREVSDILENDFNLTKIQNISQKSCNTGNGMNSEIKNDDIKPKPSLLERILRSYWTKGFLGIIIIATVIYFAIPIIFPAQIVLSTDNLNFGTMGEETPSALSFTINNNGKETLTWNVDADQPWISVSPTSGTNIGVVLVAIQGPLQPGDQRGIINVHSNAGDKQIRVSLHVEAPPEPKANPESLAFIKIGEKQPASMILSISNSGEIPLIWTASSDRSWIKLGGNTGINNGDIRVNIVEDQDPGIYQGTITIQSNARSMLIPVSLEVRRPPLMTVRPDPLVFNFDVQYGLNTGSAEPQIMTIRNDGGDVLNWLISQDPWITVDPASGSLQPGGNTEAKIGIKQDLEQRDYSGGISISSNGGEPKKGTVEIKRIETFVPVRAMAYAMQPNATATTATASSASAPPQNVKVSSPPQTVK